MATGEHRIRVLIAKVGFDPHDRAVRVLMQAWRDAGMEVIYPGKFQTAEAVVRAAIIEDVDVLALSDHCGVLPDIAADVTRLLREQGALDIAVIAGGIISADARRALEAMGVTGNFGPGTPVQTTIDHIRERSRGGRGVY